MKILLVSPEQSDQEHLQSLLEELGHEDQHLFHYSHPLKAIDNLEELEPELIIWSAVDFPRHWKVLMAMNEAESGAPKQMLVLYAHGNIEQKEIEDAKILQVAGIIQHGLKGPEGAEVLGPLLPEKRAETQPQSEQILSEPGVNSSAIPEEAGPLKVDDVTLQSSPDVPIQLIMTHPLSLKLIRGNVDSVSPENISFIPVHREDFGQLPTGSILKGSRLKIAEYVIHLDLELLPSNGQVLLKVTQPEREFLPVLRQFIHGESD